MVLRHLLRAHGIGEVHDVRIASRRLRDAAARSERTKIVAAFPRPAGAIHLLVANEQVGLARGLLEVRKDLVAAVDREHRDEFRLLDRAAILAVADVDDDGADAALGRVRYAIVDPEVVQAGIGVTIFADVLRFVDVLHVDDDVLRAAGYREEVVVRGEHVMHAASQLLVERRRDLRMGRRCQIENDDAVDAVRCALPRQRAVAAVGRDGHVVDRACIDLDRVRLHDVRHVRDVEHERPSIAAPGANKHVVAAVLAGPRPEVRRVAGGDLTTAGDGDAAAHVARCHVDDGLRVGGAGVREQGVVARIVAHKEELSIHIVDDAGAPWSGDGIVRRVDVAPSDGHAGHRAAVGSQRHAIEMNDVARANGTLLDRQLDARHGICRDDVLLLRPGAAALGRDRRAARRDASDVPEAIDAGHGRIGALPAHGDPLPLHTASEISLRGERERHACVEAPGRWRDLEPAHGGPGDGHRYVERHRRRVGSAGRRGRRCECPRFERLHVAVAEHDGATRSANPHGGVSDHIALCVVGRHFEIGRVARLHHELRRLGNEPRHRGNRGLLLCRKGNRREQGGEAKASDQIEGARYIHTIVPVVDVLMLPAFRTRGRLLPRWIPSWLSEIRVARR